ncbi:MAG: tRNA epoxyqueuosine(34) reductase QueG [Bacteroidaceae bacterium]|nr:tRNA epoxyqueuosine(34) reductase QueG [Bacteroidaceae bacterium]
MRNELNNISDFIKAEALALGFSAVGISKAEAVEKDVADAYRHWIAEGKQADMAYLENNLEKRLDPTLLMPGAKSIISLALNYYPEKKLSTEQYQFAYYAYGKDYHEVIKAKLKELVCRINDTFYGDKVEENIPTFKLCVDTVPMLDRYWAAKAGLGWIGKNTNLIIPHAGSFFFLAELITDLELSYDSPMPSRCGNCSRCIEACPGKALSPYSLDANKCLSYLTIEHRGDFSFDSQFLSNSSGLFAKSVSSFNDSSSFNSKYIYGCDRCQLACPYNNFARPTNIVEFKPSDEFLSMRPSDWKSLSVEQYRALFKGSAVKRAKYEGLVRNIKYVVGEDE